MILSFKLNSSGKISFDLNLQTLPGGLNRTHLTEEEAKEKYYQYWERQQVLDHDCVCVCVCVCVPVPAFGIMGGKVTQNQGSPARVGINKAAKATPSCRRSGKGGEVATTMGSSARSGKSKERSGAKRAVEKPLHWKS